MHGNKLQGVKRRGHETGTTQFLTMENGRHANCVESEMNWLFYGKRYLDLSFNTLFSVKKYRKW